MRQSIAARLVFVLLGFAAVGFVSILTLRFDHRRGTIILHYRSLLRASTKTLFRNEIGCVYVKEDNGEGTYRVEHLGNRPQFDDAFGSGFGDVD